MPEYSDIRWLALLETVDVVVHCAARVHIMNDIPNPLDVFLKANKDATLELAKKAKESGVKKFIYISTIKVNGEQSLPGRPFCASDEPNPSDPYAISKWEGEKAVAKAAGMEMEWIVIRPPLVYGANVKGNLALFKKIAKFRVPLPLGQFENRRSLVSLDNLVAFISHCCFEDIPANDVYLVADPKPFSTAEIYQRICEEASLPGRVFSLPSIFLPVFYVLLRKFDAYDRLATSLEVCCKKTIDETGWKPK